MLLRLPGIAVTLYPFLEDVPPFNPDHDIDPAPPAVAHWRGHVSASDALLFCTPEYAHGVPGALKNALDWLVGSGETSQKPFALWNTSPRSTYAQNSLREILTTMDALPVPDACADFFLPRPPDAALVATDLALRPHMENALRVLADAVWR